MSSPASRYAPIRSRSSGSSPVRTQLVDPTKLLLEPPTAATEITSQSSKVNVADADTHAQLEATAGDDVDRRSLLGHIARLARRQQQRRRDEPNALRDSGGCREGHEWIPRVVVGTIVGRDCGEPGLQDELWIDGRAEVPRKPDAKLQTLSPCALMGRVGPTRCVIVLYGVRLYARAADGTIAAATTRRQSACGPTEMSG
jgi:hypothetical protein